MGYINRPAILCNNGSGMGPKSIGVMGARSRALLIAVAGFRVAERPAARCRSPKKSPLCKAHIARGVMRHPWGWGCRFLPQTDHEARREACPDISHISETLTLRALRGTRSHLFGTEYAVPHAAPLLSSLATSRASAVACSHLGNAWRKATGSLATSAARIRSSHRSWPLRSRVSLSPAEISV
jgi:hypothetical protein